MVTEVSEEYKQTHSFRDYFVDTFVNPLYDSIRVASSASRDTKSGSGERFLAALGNVYDACDKLDEAISYYSERFEGSNFTDAANFLVEKKLSSFFDDHKYPFQPGTSYHSTFGAIVDTMRVRKESELRDAFFNVYPDGTSESYLSVTEDFGFSIGRSFIDAQGQSWLPLAYTHVDKPDMIALAVPFDSEGFDFDKTEAIGKISPSRWPTDEYEVAYLSYKGRAECDKLLRNLVFDFATGPDFPHQQFFDGESPVELDTYCNDDIYVDPSPFSITKSRFVSFCKKDLGLVDALSNLNMSLDKFNWDNLESLPDDVTDEVIASKFFKEYFDEKFVQPLCSSLNAVCSGSVFSDGKSNIIDALKDVYAARNRLYAGISEYVEKFHDDSFLDAALGLARKQIIDRNDTGKLSGDKIFSNCYYGVSDLVDFFVNDALHDHEHDIVSSRSHLMHNPNVFTPIYSDDRQLNQMGYVANDGKCIISVGNVFSDVEGNVWQPLACYDMRDSSDVVTLVGVPVYDSVLDFENTALIGVIDSYADYSISMGCNSAAFDFMITPHEDYRYRADAFDDSSYTGNFIRGGECRTLNELFGSKDAFIRECQPIVNEYSVAAIGWDSFGWDKLDDFVPQTPGFEEASAAANPDQLDESVANYESHEGLQSDTGLHHA